MRMVLKAYICLNGNVTRVNDEGSSTLEQIMDRRPNHCQFAVVGADSVVWVVDLYDLQVTPDRKDLYLGQYWVHPDIDTAIAAMVLGGGL